INEAIANNIIIERDSLYQFSLSFLPYDDYIILREVNSDYDLFHSDPEKIGHPEFDNSVWVGADSIMYTRHLKKLLNKKTFNRGIEIGSGTGILSIAGSNFTKEFHAIDYNERAVAYTKLNIDINNNLNIKSYFSDMFKNVSGKFDLILAAPWFVDLEKSGLEEVPFILDNLDKYLDDEGVCLMTLNSYVKNGVDENIEFIKAFIKKNNYSFELHRMGYQIERERFKDWKKHNIDYVASFFAVIKKNKSFLKIHDVSIFRKIRDFTFIFLYKILNK
ncbi:methyltransferase, partial [Pelagibacteraceae bacterium]|nr:methyltransferase [Pelagibacteraceae bacterium]